MFDLEQALAEWRRQMSAGGLVALEALDELEIHLRDDIEIKIHSGVSPQAAFKTAAEQLGPAGPLHAEFLKINPITPMKPFIEMWIGLINPTLPVKPMVKILLGLAFIATGVAMILPAMAKLNMEGAIPLPIVNYLIVGTVITTSGGWVLLQGIVVRAPKPAR